MNRLTSVSWLLCLVATVMMAVFWLELRTERARHADLAARMAELESRWSPQVAAGIALHEPVATSRPAGSQAAAPGVAPQTQANGSATMLNSGLQEVLNSPGGQEFQRVLQRQALIDRYPDIQEALGLSSNDADRLMDLLARSRSDLAAERLRLSRDRTLDRAAREEQHRRLAERERANEGEVATLLGDKYQAWKEYDRASIERQVQRFEQQGRDELRAAISTSSNPLSPAMFDPLVKALDAEQKKIDQESVRLNASARVQRLPQDQQRMMSIAAQYLNADQLARYQRYLDGQALTVRAMAGLVEEAERAP